MEEPADEYGDIHDHSNALVPPFILLGVTALIGLLLDAATGASFGTLLAGIFRLPGMLLLLVGGAIIGIAGFQFSSEGTNFQSRKSTHKVVTSGLYHWSRNPVYLGCIIVGIGLVLRFDAPVLGVLLVPALMALRYAVIAREEEYLERKFGSEYLAYKEAVNRWFGRQPT